VTKIQAGHGATAPAVYLNDTALAEIKGVRDGKISEQELIDELTRANVPRKKNDSGCSCCCG
jgi:hypothetical protein